MNPYVIHLYLHKQYIIVFDTKQNWFMSQCIKTCLQQNLDNDEVFLACLNCISAAFYTNVLDHGAI